MDATDTPASRFLRRSRTARCSDGSPLVAELDGEIVGRITLGTNGHDGDISGFVVIKRSRRQGIGTALMDAAEEEARRRGCARMRLTVAKGNTGALLLYAARGYQRVAQGMSAGLRTPEGVVVHAPEPVWEMVTTISSSSMVSSRDMSAVLSAMTNCAAICLVVVALNPCWANNFVATARICWRRSLPGTRGSLAFM